MGDRSEDSQDCDRSGSDDSQFDDYADSYSSDDEQNNGGSFQMEEEDLPLIVKTTPVSNQFGTFTMADDDEDLPIMSTPTVAMPPAPTVAMPPAPTVAMPPAPTVAMPPAPTVAMPPAPTVAMPPAPTFSISPEEMKEEMKEEKEEETKDEQDIPEERKPDQFHQHPGRQIQAGLWHGKSEADRAREEGASELRSAGTVMMAPRSTRPRQRLVQSFKPCIVQVATAATETPVKPETQQSVVARIKAQALERQKERAKQEAAQEALKVEEEKKKKELTPEEKAEKEKAEEERKKKKEEKIEKEKEELKRKREESIAQKEEAKRMKKDAEEQKAKKLEAIRKESDRPREQRAAEPVRHYKADGWNYDWKKPSLVAESSAGVFNEEITDNIFLKKVLWSPDGTCLLTTAEDNKVRMFEVPTSLYTSGQPDFANPTTPHQVDPILTVKCSEAVYSAAWYPFMKSTDPSSCIFATTSRCQPIHLWDAYSGAVRATYTALDDNEEPQSAYSLAFTPAGGTIFAGYLQGLRVFDVSRPGPSILEARTWKDKRGKRVLKPQRGILSSIDVSKDSSQVAVGSFNGTVALYSATDLRCRAVLRGHKGGVVQTKFSGCGRYIVSAARQDKCILIWDIRRPGKILHRLPHLSPTNQPLYFDVNPAGTTLMTGSISGRPTVFDIATCEELETNLPYIPDVVNSVGFHPVLPLVVCGTGRRRWPNYDSDSESDNNPEGVPQTMDSLYDSSKGKNGISIYRVPAVWGEVKGLENR